MKNKGTIIRNRRKTILICIAFLFVFIFGGLIGAYLNGYNGKRKLNNYMVNNHQFRWYELKKTLKYNVIHAKTKPVECPKEYKAIATFGQSNSANRLLRSKNLKTVDDGKTYMWDWGTQRCYKYEEPIVGTDGKNRGNIITYTIQELRKSDRKTNIIVIAFGRGGSSVFSWSHGVESIRLDNVLKKLSINKIKPTLFLWHQGESDAIEEMYLPNKVKAYGPKKGTKKRYYGMALEVVIQKVHAMFPNALIGVALASICDNEGSQEVRGAQKIIANKYPWVKISSDTDTYGDEYRYEDKCHFNEKGEKHIGADYLKLLLKQIP
jgi:hypothetical protein